MMSVRTLLFSLLAAVFVGLVAIQWWVTRQQHEELAQALSTTAFTVSRDTISVLLFEQSDDEPLLHDQSFEMRLDNSPVHGSIVLSSPQFQHRIDIPKAGMQKTLAASQRKQLLLVLIISVLGVFAALMIAYQFSRPLRQLQQAAQHVASGQFGQQLPTPAFAPQEITQSLAAFNQMSRDLQKLEEDNRRLRAQQQVDELSDLARGLAHTMRNPLNTLGLSIEEMANSSNDDEARQQLAVTARRQIQTIDKRLRALLDVSTQHEPNLSLSIVSILQDIRSEFNDYPIVIEGDLSAKLIAQSRELSMVFHTLISNAIEACSDKKPIQINVAKLQGKLRVDITDQGNGIAENIFPRLFQPHVSTKQHGAGLGLYLAKRVISGHYDGDIEFSSNTPQGTRATVILHDRRN